jgi:hypothetical protein
MPLLDPETVAVVMSALEAPVPTVSAQTFQTMAAGTRVQLITAGHRIRNRGRSALG